MYPCIHMYMYIYIRTSGLHKTLYIYTIYVHGECHAKPNKLNLLTIRQNTIRVLQCAGMSPSGKPFEKHLLEPIFETILKKHSFANFKEPTLETILCGSPFWNQKHADLESIQNQRKNNILEMPQNMESIQETIQKQKKNNIGRMSKQSRKQS